MNNLKRVLSLALSTIMLVGMMAVGASAADFTDADKIEHEDAVNILVALKVINGQDDGSFNPQGDVTRGQMAKMIAVAMNGGSEANTGTKTTPSFTDVKGHWAESYIEYCYDLGIINGRGDGTFDPDGNVTGLEATKMVLTALGYEAEAYKLKGDKWAVRTDELARAASPSLYEELDNTVLSGKASRDTAAQLIWNGLQNKTKKVKPSQNTNTGEITWIYENGTAADLLEERYGAKRLSGVYEGNEKSGATSEKGEIVVAGVSFPSDLGIENIGEDVMVIWKDRKDGTAGQPDKHDTIYGVFNTGKTQVYKITKADMQDADKDLARHKIKFSGSLHDIAPAKDTSGNITGYPVYVEYNYDTSDNETLTDASGVQGGLKAQAVDEIKFVCDLDGKINAAYVTGYTIARVTGINANKITISNVGAINVADNDIEEGLEKDDVVVYTRFYDSSDKDKAFFTVKKAETVEGMLTGFKRGQSDNKYTNIVVDGTTYKVNYPSTSLPSITANDPINTMTDGVAENVGETSIGDTVRLFKVGDMIGAAQSIENAGGKYAVVTEVSVGANDSVKSVMNPLKVSVMLSDGSKQTLNVHKDSTYEANAGSTTFKFADLPAGTSGSVTANAAVTSSTQQADVFSGAVNGTGDLIEYTSISNGSIKIKRVIRGASTASGTTNVWDQDSKVMAWTSAGAGGGNNTGVAATDAVMFVGVDELAEISGSNPKKFTGDGTVDSWNAYTLRGLSDVKNEYFNGHTSGTPTDAKVTASVITDNKGLVRAAFIVRNGKPASSTADTLYGMITGFVGTRQNADGDDLWKYTVAVNRDEEVEIAVLKKDGVPAVGDLVKFDERSDGEYSMGDKDIVVLVQSNDVVATTANGLEASTKVELASIVSYNEGQQLLTYLPATSFDASTQTYGEKDPVSSITVAKDLKVIGIDANAGKDTLDSGIMSYNTATGYANALLHFNDKNIVDAIIMETSGEVNLAVKNPAAVRTAKFGNATVTLASGATAVPSAPGLYTNKNGATITGATVNASYVDVKDLLFFRFTAAGAAQDYTLTIGTKAGLKDVYEEKATGLAAGSYFFYVDAEGHCPNAIGGTLKGDAATTRGTALVSGTTYYYQIKGADGNVYLSDSFVYTDATP